jgi:hypothetical protein
MGAMDLGAELGAKIFVLWGGREGVETDACRRPDEAVKRLREAINYLCEYNIDKKYGYKFALEAKPNEPRGDIYMATIGHYLGFIPTLDHPEMVGVNPEFEKHAWHNLKLRGFTQHASDSVWPHLYLPIAAPTPTRSRPLCESSSTRITLACPVINAGVFPWGHDRKPNLRSNA